MIYTQRDHKWVYRFEEGRSEMKSLLGGKGANVAEMSRVGLPVPPGFTITTEACNGYTAYGRQFPEGMWTQARDALKQVETLTGKGFGDVANPLLVSVRSGAAISMPGMMDTVLNLGLNDETVEGLARLSANRRFALDAYRRFIEMFGNIVMGVGAEKFSRVIERFKVQTTGGSVTDLSESQLEEIISAFKTIVFADRHGDSFPQDPQEQLRMAIAAVFDSWETQRAVNYRRVHRIPDDLGTAVNVQAMVFGNLGWESGTGVAFTRNPSTGEKIFFGEYLLNAQGEDVVAGIRTPKPIQELADELPDVYAQLIEITQRLERHYQDMQDIEFTVERGKLWMLQTRAGKRAGAAAVRIAVDMVEEGVISREEAVMRVDANQLDQLLHPTVAADADVLLLTTGLPASPGAAAGQVVLSPDEAVARAAEGVPVILVRLETSPDDFIELPRAALRADTIAAHADFFSFGTNDLTQTTFGLSRDDSARFLSHYITEKLLPDDPFQVLDQAGVGELFEIGTQRGRATKPALKVGICGEHGGEPRSIDFCHRIGLDYVSCSPFRVPIARLAAAQATLREQQQAEPS